MAKKIDTKELLNTHFTEEHETRRDPVPQGDYPGEVMTVDIVDREDKDGNTMFMLNFSARLEDDDLHEQFGQYPLCSGTIFLDLDEDGNFEYGPNKNVKLGQWREALGINSPEYSVADAIGRRAIFGVKHRQDKEDSSITYDQINTYAPEED